MADCDQSSKIKVSLYWVFIVVNCGTPEYEFSCGQSGSLHRAPPTNY